MYPHGEPFSHKSGSLACRQSTHHSIRQPGNQCYQLVCSQVRFTALLFPDFADQNTEYHDQYANTHCQLFPRETPANETAEPANRAFDITELQQRLEAEYRESQYFVTGLFCLRHPHEPW